MVQETISSGTREKTPTCHGEEEILKNLAKRQYRQGKRASPLEVRPNTCLKLFLERNGIDNRR